MRIINRLFIERILIIIKLLIFKRFGWIGNYYHNYYYLKMTSDDLYEYTGSFWQMQHFHLPDNVSRYSSMKYFLLMHQVFQLNSYIGFKVNGTGKISPNIKYKPTSAILINIINGFLYGGCI